jgi:CHAT domain-containing protein
LKQTVMHRVPSWRKAARSALILRCLIAVALAWAIGEAGAVGKLDELGLDPSGMSRYSTILNEAQADLPVMRGAAAGVDVPTMFRDFETSNFQSALEKIEELIEQLTAAGDTAPTARLALASAIDFRGLIEQRLGKLYDAKASHGKALKAIEMLDKLKAAEGLAVRNNLAVASYLLGEYEASAQILTEMLEDRKIPPQVRARARNNRGLIYLETGNSDKALIDFSRAEAEARLLLIPLPRLLAEILNNEAMLWSQMKNQFRAEEALKEALQLVKQFGDRALEANILDSWGEILLANGEFDKAFEKLELAAVAEASAYAPLVRTTLLKNKGRALVGLGRLEEAAKVYAEALSLANDTGYSALRREILTSQGKLQVKFNHLDQAIADFGSAITIVNNTREKLRQETEADFAQATQGLYEQMVAALLKRRGPGDEEEALSFLERSRSAALQEQMAADIPELRDKQVLQDIRGARGTLRQEAALARQLQEKLAASSPNKQEIDRLRQQLVAARSKAAAALGELQEKYAGRYDHFVPAAISPKYLEDVRKRLPPGSLMVTYALGEDRLYFFLTSKDGKTEFRQNTNVTKLELEKKIEEYRNLLTMVRGDSADWRIDSWNDPKWASLRDATLWLYQQLLEPIKHDIDKANLLIFAPTGQLYYLPIHALGPMDPASGQIRYLALDKKISYVSPGSLSRAFLSPASEPAAAKTEARILALGNVEYEPLLNRLVFSAKELQAIKGIFGAQATLLGGKKATKSGLLAALKSDGPAPSAAAPGRAAAPSGFQFVVLSTHGILDSSNPRKSHLALEHGKKLEAAEIAALDLRGVSLLALSACETALADKNPGADIMSLGEYASVAGAGSVIASLWSVDDSATADLMKRFYTQLKRDGQDKLSALKTAQTALASRPETRHPFFWAPFILYGKGW